MARCQASMAQLGVGFHAYASDAKGWLAAFSWQPGETYSQWAELNNATTSTDAHCNQAADIVRRLTGRQHPKFENRMVDRNFTPMVLAAGGYLGSDSLPVAGVVCPDDSAGLLWSRTRPDDMLSLPPEQQGDVEADDGYRQLLPYWSTYQLVPAVWSSAKPNQGITQSFNDYRLYSHYENTKFVNKRMDEVAFASQKVLMFDLFDRHKTRGSLFHAYPDATQPLLFCDGSVQVKRTRDSNQGWNPLDPTNLLATTIYQYRAIEPTDPLPRSGTALGETVRGMYRWTRWGMRGIDFGAREPSRRP